jgi:hypothetical protein
MIFGVTHSVSQQSLSSFWLRKMIQDMKTHKKIIAYYIKVSVKFFLSFFFHQNLTEISKFSTFFSKKKIFLNSNYRKPEKVLRASVYKELHYNKINSTSKVMELNEEIKIFYLVRSLNFLKIFCTSIFSKLIAFRKYFRLFSVHNACDSSRI